MPSEDAKPVKKQVVKKEEDEDEDKSLKSILQSRKKNQPNAAISAEKSGPKVTKVKKAEPQDNDDDDFDASIKGKGKDSSSSGSKPANKVKKEEIQDDDDDDHKPIAKRVSATKPDKIKELSKKKVKKEEEKKRGSATAVQNGQKRERKTYDLPGQRRDPPEERDPLRIFYETLYQQVPKSEMAQFWLMESGLLSLEEAKRVYEKKRSKLTSPMKSVTATKRTQTASVTKKTPSSAVSSTKSNTTHSKLSSSTKTKTTDSKSASKLPRKRKIDDGSSGDDSDDDFLIKKSTKKQKAS